MAGISYFPESTNPSAQDGELRILTKILGATLDGGSGGGGSVLSGSGNPNGSVTGSPGDIYTDLNTGQIYSTVDGTTWGP